MPCHLVELLLALKVWLLSSSFHMLILLVRSLTAKDGVVLVTEKKLPQLMDADSISKISKLTDNIGLSFFTFYLFICSFSQGWCMQEWVLIAAC